MDIQTVKTLITVWLCLMLTPALASPLQESADVDVEMVRAARAGDASRVGDLLGRGARVNARVLLGNGLGTAISEAAAGGFSKIVQLLLSAGAAVDLIDNNGWTALMSADNRDVIRVLLDAGADLDAMDVNGWTALMLLDDIDLVEFLLAEGAAIDKENSYGWTALMWAAFNGLTDKVKFLLGTGADVVFRDNQGRTALLLAYRGNRNAVEVLIEAGADPNAKDETGSTALMGAALSVDSGKIQFLIDAGADVNAMDEDGTTALMLADSLGHTDVASVLRGAGAEE